MTSARGLLALLAVAFLVAGCEKEPVPLPEPEKPAAVSPALRTALVEMVTRAPADALLVGTLQSPRALVDDLNAFAGPELATIAAVPFSILPPGVVDVEQPVAWTVFMGQGGPKVVFLMHLKDPARLEGEAVEGGILKMKSLVRAAPPIFAMRMDKWVAFSGGPAALKAFKTADSCFAVPDAMAARIGESLAWLYVNAEPLAAMAVPLIQQVKAQELGEQTGETPSAKAKFFEWAEDLVQQIENLEVGLDADGDRGVLRVGLTLRQDASLLAVAAALKPIDNYEAALPPTDRFLVATWSRIDHAEAGTRLKAFLEPVMDAVFQTLDEALAKQAAGPDAVPGTSPPAVLEPLNKAIKELWAMIDEQGEVLGDQSAVLMEMPEPGQGLYRMTQIVALKDGAAYRALTKRGMEAAEDLYRAILGMVPKNPDTPKMDVAFDYQGAAETIEGLSVDVIRFKFDMTPPEDAPPRVRAMFKGMMDEIYGPEGLVMRVAVWDDRAIIALGGADVMARAIKNLRAGDADLAKQEAVRAALGRAPAGSSAVQLVSLPAYGYLVSTMLDRVLPMMLPPDAKRGYEQALLPRLDVPQIGEPMLVAVRVDGRTIRLDLDLPASELTRTIPVIRHAVSRAMFYGVHAAARAANDAFDRAFEQMDVPPQGGTWPGMGKPPTVPQGQPPGEFSR